MKRVADYKTKPHTQTANGNHVTFLNLYIDVYLFILQITCGLYPVCELCPLLSVQESFHHHVHNGPSGSNDVV